MQGGPLSSLLSNIVLDELDQELENRGLEFCRFADDCNLFVKSQKAAEWVMETVSQFIEKKLKLKVNQEKSQVADSSKVKFLGFTVVNGTIAIAHKALQTAMDKVKALILRGTHNALETTLDKINQWYVGWSNYYSLTNYPSQLGKIEAPIRRRLRSRLVSQKERKRHFIKIWHIGLTFLNGYVLHEAPCTDPYARFCGQTEAAASSDPIIAPQQSPTSGAIRLSRLTALQTNP